MRMNQEALDAEMLLYFEKKYFGKLNIKIIVDKLPHRDITKGILIIM